MFEKWKELLTCSKEDGNFSCEKQFCNELLITDEDCGSTLSLSSESVDVSISSFIVSTTAGWYDLK